MQTEEVVQELEADRRSPEGSGWMRYTWDRLLQRDIFAVVSRSEQLMRMHTTAEQFDPITEYFLAAMQASCSAVKPCNRWALCCFAFCHRTIHARFHVYRCRYQIWLWPKRSHPNSIMPCMLELHCTFTSGPEAILACMATLHTLWLWLSIDRMLLHGINPVK